MKKCVALLLSLLLVLACCGCNDSGTKENAVCYLLDQSNSLPGIAKDIPVASESKWWNGISFKSDSAKKEKTAEFGGKTYTGSYKYSYYDDYNSFETDYYDGGDGLEFGINAANGKLVYINLKTLSFFEEEPLLPEKSGIEDESAKIAKDVASQFADISEYELISSDVTPFQPDDLQKPSMKFYTYTYCKTVNGVNSSAYVTVQVTSKGNIACVVVGDTDAFAGNVSQKVKAYKNIDVDGIVLDTMDEITKDLESPTCKIEKKYYSVSPDGEVVVVVSATCDYYEIIDGEVSEYPSGAGFVFVVK